jgi:hypothetical protein
MRSSFWVVCVCVGAVAIGARGDSLGLDFTGGGGFTAGTFQNEGWKFSVSKQITVSGLAVFDFGSNGLSQSHQAGLWNADGSVLLASGMVTNSSPLVASTDSLGGWRTVAITPLVLQAGDYVVGANYPNAATEDPFVALGAASNGGTITTLQGITWLETRFTHKSRHRIRRSTADFSGPISSWRVRCRRRRWWGAVCWWVLRCGIGLGAGVRDQRGGAIVTLRLGGSSWRTIEQAECEIETHQRL